MTSYERCRIEGTESYVDKLIATEARHAGGEDLIKQGQAICQQAEDEEKLITDDMRTKGYSEDDVADAVQAAFRHLYPAAYETCN